MIQNKYVVGILGGVGAGKSTVLNYICGTYRVDILKADDIGKELMRPGKSIFKALTKEYGDAVLNEDGMIDAKAVAAIGFKDKESQEKLNSIEHPLIKEEIVKRIEGSRYTVVFLEAALLIEGGLKDLCDEIWLITAKEDVRKERLMKDRGYSEEKCRQIMDLQMDDSEFKKYANVSLSNNRDVNRMKEEAEYYMDALAADLKLDLMRH